MPDLLHAQTGFPGYYRFIRQMQLADSLYQASRYVQAAEAFLATAQVKVEKGIDMPVAEMYYYAACGFAQGKKFRKAFLCLDTLAADYSFADTLRLIQEEALLPLRQKSSWDGMLFHVRGNALEQARWEDVFVRRTTLPPGNTNIVFQPLTPFARSFLMQDTLPWLSFNHGIFNVYFSGDGYAGRQIDLIKAQLSDAYQRDIEVLGIDAYRQGITIVLFNDVEEMKVITGVRAQGGIAYPSDHLAFFPYHQWRRPQFRHELFHVMANNTWGITHSRLLNEGSAVFADNQCLVENPIDATNAWLLHQEKLFTLQALTEDFDAKARESDVIAYLQAAGIFKYLYEHYGLDKIKSLWIRGFDAFTEIYGMKLDAFERDWLEYIRQIPLPVNFDGDAFLSTGCG